MSNMRMLAVIAIAIAAPLAPTRAADLSPLDWPTAGNGIGDDHLAPLEFLLGPRTVPFPKLRGTLTADGDVEGTPTVQGGTLCFTDNAGSIWHVDSFTGRVLWKASLPATTGVAGSYSRNSPTVGDGAVAGDRRPGLEDDRRRQHRYADHQLGARGARPRLHRRVVQPGDARRLHARLRGRLPRLGGGTRRGHRPHRLADLHGSAGLHRGLGLVRQHPVP